MNSLISSCYTCFHFIIWNYEMVWFDVKSIFTSVPLELTIDIIIKRIDEKDEITSVFTKNEMKKLLTICTRNVHFSFNNDIYIWIDVVAMGSPLDPVLPNIFMVELESVLVNYWLIKRSCQKMDVFCGWHLCIR